MSTALGRALAGRPTVVWVGDIAFVHDANALVAITERAADLRIVVADNRGGGIFSFLPQASALEAERFEQLFGTPHDTDIEALAGAHRVPAGTVERAAEPAVTRVVTDRAENVQVHHELNDAVAACLG
jgi:2-succinyl-5-enolpyruvyl-6-hydroxy-3-cyclohexene-1-carboxylate synthase